MELKRVKAFALNGEDQMMTKALNAMTTSTRAKLVATTALGASLMLT